MSKGLKHLPWAIALVCVVLGFMLSMQFKVQKQVTLADVSRVQRTEELAAQLQKAEEVRDSLQVELDELRGQLRNMASAQQEYQALAQQLEQAQVHAGLLPMEGPGVVVTLDDSNRPVTPGENANNFIIHDEDVLRVVNELLAARAEAISINGQRITSRTEIRCTGPVVTINGVRTAPPLLITAIGDPTELENALTMKGGVAESVRFWGIQLSVKKENTLSVPAYKSSLRLQYAAPAKEVKP